MKVLSLFTICVLAVAHGATNFHCARSVDACQNGGECNPTTGACKCAPTFIGHDCSVGPNEQLQKCKKCLNDGQCVKSSQACHCTPEYTGTTCEIKRAQVLSCTRKDMKIQVIPQNEATFKGKVTFLMDKPNAKCDSIIPKKGNAFVRDFPLKDELKDCVGSREMKDLPNGGKSHTYRVLTQYNPDFVFGTDQVHIFTCSDDNTIATTFSLQKERTKLVGVKKEESYSPVAMTILDKSKSVVSSPVKVGETVHLAFTVKTDSRYKYERVRVTECTAYDKVNREKGPVEEFELIKNKCPVPTANSVVLPPLAEETQAFRTLVPLRAFKFVGSNVVAIQCKLYLCQLNAKDAECDLKDCAGKLTKNLGRRRRAAVKDGGNTTSVSARFTVVFNDPPSVERQEQRAEIDVIIPPAQPCESDQTFIVVLSVTAAVALTALATAVVFVGLSRRSRVVTAKI